MYDEDKLNEWKEKQNFLLGYERDVCQMVQEAESELYFISFPFSVESTAG